MIDAIKVGDWLLANGHLEWSDLHRLLPRSTCGEPALTRRSGSSPGSTATRGRCRSPRCVRSWSSPACRPPSRTWVPVLPTTQPHRRPRLPPVGGRSSSTRASTTSSIARSTSRTSTATPPCGEQAVPYVQVTKEKLAAPAVHGPRGVTRPSSLAGTTARHPSSASGGASCSHASPTWLQRTGGGPRVGSRTTETNPRPTATPHETNPHSPPPRRTPLACGRDVPRRAAGPRRSEPLLPAGGDQADPRHLRTGRRADREGEAVRRADRAQERPAGGAGDGFPAAVRGAGGGAAGPGRRAGVGHEPARGPGPAHERPAPGGRGVPVATPRARPGDGPRGGRRARRAAGRRHGP